MAERQAEQEGFAYVALGKGFASCQDAVCLQKTCDELEAVSVRSFFERWVHRVPSPFTAADREAGLFYDLAFRQIEFSDTGVFDCSTAGRTWFETTIPEHLDLERPDQAALVSSRRINRRTAGRFATRVITRGVDPSIQIHYKSSKQKQCFKESEALRTETTINDTHDCGVGRLVTNGVGAPRLRFGDPRVVALLASLVSFTHVVAGCAIATLRSIVEGHLGRPCLSRQMTYDLRRPTRKSLIERQKGTHRYRLIPEERRLSMFFTKIYTRIVTPSPRYLDPGLPPEVSTRAPVARAWRDLDHARKRPHRSVRGCGLKFDLFRQMLQT